MIAHFLIRISVVLVILVFLFLACLLLGIDLNMVLMKLQSMLLGKSLHLLFSRLGWCGGGLILVVSMFIEPEPIGKMMAPSGASGAGCTGSGVERWLNQENASSNPRELEDDAGTSASGTTRPRPSSPFSPLPSISSIGDSWISEAYGGRGDTSSSAPHPSPEEAHDPTQVNEAPPLAQGALPQELNAPSVLELRHRLDHFASSFNRIAMRSDYLIGLNERLELTESTPERRNQILEGMRIISALQGRERPTSGKRAGDALVAFMREWDQKQA
uniref:Uncharacterized protein n=1 Tax=Sesuvium portulacastrum TaxID=221166 RepID=A0A6B9MM66_SESPO|nr:hypothetical protein [Sesuvium portulacastrum]